MKFNRTLVKPFWAVLFILFSSVGICQTMIEQPKYGFSTVRNITLEKIEKTDSETRLYLTFRAKPNTFVLVFSETCLYEPKTERKHYLIRAEGLTVNKTKRVPYSGELSYTLVFPKIKKRVERVDFTNNGYKCYIHDIELHQSDRQVFIGKWYNDNTGLLEVAFREALLVYNSKVWDYTVKADDDNSEAYQVIAYDETDTINLSFTYGESSSLINGVDTVICQKSREACHVDSPVNNSILTSFDFIPDTAILKGFIEGYKKGVNTDIYWHTINSFTLLDNDKLIRVDANGYFCEKIPLYHPQQVRIKSAIYDGNLFLEPGKELFVFFDKQNKSYEPELMGEMARINTELLELSVLDNYDYLTKKSKVISLEPNGYKEWLLGEMANELNDLVARADTINYTAKTVQVKELSIKCRYANAILNYYSYYERAYRIKNKLKYSVPVEIKYFPEGYGNFFVADMINNPVGFVAKDFVELSRNMLSSDYIKLEQDISNQDLFNYLKFSGQKLTKEEEHLCALITGQDSLKQLKKYRYITGLKNTKEILISRYKEEYQNWVVARGYPFFLFGQILIKNGYELNKGEMKLIETYVKYEQEPIVVECRKKQRKLDALFEKFNSHLLKAKMYTDINVVAKFFENNSYLEKGLLSDLVIAHIIAEYINETKKALTGADFRFYVDHITNSRVAQIITEYNSDLLVEANEGIATRN